MCFVYGLYTGSVRVAFREYRQKCPNSTVPRYTRRFLSLPPYVVYLLQLSNKVFLDLCLYEIFVLFLFEKQTSEICMETCRTLCIEDFLFKQNL